MHEAVFLVGHLDPGTVALTQKIVYGLHTQTVNDASRQELVVHSLEFATSSGRSLLLRGLRTNLSSSVVHDQSFQLLFYKDDELIGWTSSSTNTSIAPGATQRWSAAVNTVDASVSIVDLEQATVMFAGNGNFSEETPEVRELVASLPTEITFEEVPGWLPLSKVWTEFDDRGNLNVYGIFVNDRYYPIRLNREYVTYLNEDGIELASRNIGGTIFNPSNMVIYPGERVFHQTRFSASADPDIAAFTAYIRFGLNGDRVVSGARPDIAIHSLEVVERSRGMFEASFLRTNLSADVYPSQAFQVLFVVDDEVIAWAPARISSGGIRRRWLLRRRAVVRERPGCTPGLISALGLLRVLCSDQFLPNSAVMTNRLP